MHKRERLENTIAGHATDRPPVALWRHFPGDDQRPSDFARSLVEFQATYDWDMLLVAPYSAYSVMDYGAVFEWKGQLDGDRTLSSAAIARSLTWTELRPLDPQRGEHGKLLEVVRLLREDLHDRVPLVVMLYSPLAQAERLAGRGAFLRDLRAYGDRLHTGLNTLTENTLRFMEALRRAGVDGICYVVEHADVDRLAETEYRTFGLPYDQKLMGELPPAWWLNMLRLTAEMPMFNVTESLALPVTLWRSSYNKPDLARGKSLVVGAVAGGLPTTSLQNDAVTTVRADARDAIQLTNGRRLILMNEEPLLLSTPLANLRTVKAVVDSAKGAS